MAKLCKGVVIITVVAVIIVFLAILPTTSPQSYHRCPGGAVQWDARTNSNDTTILTCRKLWRRYCSAKSSPRTGRRTLVIGTGYTHFTNL